MSTWWLTALGDALNHITATASSDQETNAANAVTR